MELANHLVLSVEMEIGSLKYGKIIQNEVIRYCGYGHVFIHFVDVKNQRISLIN